MPVNDKYEIKTFCVKEDQVGINVRHWITISEITGGASLQEMVDAYSNTVAPLQKPWMPAAARFAGCSLQPITVIPPVTAAVTSHIGSGDGTASGDLLPTQASALIHLLTGVPGRHGRGRIYIPFASEAFNDVDNLLTAGGVGRADALRVFYTTPLIFVGATGDTTLAPCVRNRVTNAFSVITESFVDFKWATQRRRGGFGRTNPIPVL